MASTTKFLGAVGLLVLSALSTVDAHGYVLTPPSRQAWCNKFKDQDFGRACGAVQYEPQSVESPSGSPFGEKDIGEMVCSGGVPNRPDLDGVDNPAISWPQTTVTSGQDITFQWVFHQPHNTRDFHYYITKPNFVYPKDRGLTKHDFEETPIEIESFNGVAPSPWNSTVRGSKLGGRTGDVVILAVWEIGDTTNSFYNCVDLKVQSGHDHGSQPDPGQGTIQFPNYVGNFGLECTWKPLLQTAGRRLRSSWRH